MLDPRHLWWWEPTWGQVRNYLAWRSPRCWPLRCKVSYSIMRPTITLFTDLRALRRPSLRLGGWSFSSLTQPLTSTLLALTNAPLGCTWSYRITSPTITRRTNSCVSSRWNCDIKFLKRIYTRSITMFMSNKNCMERWSCASAVRVTAVQGLSLSKAYTNYKCTETSFIRFLCNENSSSKTGKISFFGNLQ